MTKPRGLWVFTTMFLGLVGAGSAMGQTPDRCALRVVVVDVDGTPIPAAVHPVDAAAAPVWPDGSATCVAVGAGVRELRVLVTADGFQPFATDAVEVRTGSTRSIEVTLVRPFSDSLSVVGRAASLIGVADSASTGIVGARDLALRPLARTGDLLEAVPGVAMTQHSSGGHAPIVLLRGYNLDHGTDFATSFEGVPLNLPSHAHAQGYTDTSFLIEDLVRQIEFQKGPYSARTGNFGTAGSAHIELVDEVPATVVRADAGGHGFRRLLAFGSTGNTRHRFVAGAEASHDDGPSEVPDNFGRVKAVARYAHTATDGGHLALTYAGYRSAWTATDGYPRRALERGDVSRFGTLDATDGGRTQQHLLALTTRRSSGRGLVTAGAFARYYDLDLFSNLTFWTQSPDGDQIWQADRRLSLGGHATVTRSLPMRSVHLDLTGGVQARHDGTRVRLSNTDGRMPRARRSLTGALVEAVREAARIQESSLSPFGEVRVRLTPWLRTTAGLRLDTVRMRVQSQLPMNSGTVWSSTASPAVTVAFGPWRGTEVYGNAGFGFHSNHALGVTQRVDTDTRQPTRLDGSVVAPVEPLVRTRGAEAGIRLAPTPRMQSSIAVWLLDSGSELIYTAEDGVTSPERPGRRHGVEWLNVVALHPMLQADVDLAWSTSRYRTDPRGEGRVIPDAARAVAGAGLTLTITRLGASLRGRYVGRRPLEPSGAVFVEGAFLMNGSVELRVSPRLRVAMQGFNLFDRAYEDTAYYYATRLRDPRTGVLEANAVSDYVTHPGQPRTLRIGMRVEF